MLAPLLVAPLLLVLAGPVRPLKFSAERADGSAACPDEASLRSSVVSRLGFDPFEPSAAAALQVVIAPHAPGHHAEIALLDEAGRRMGRQLAGVRPDCSDLAEALALSLSVAVEAFVATPAPEPAPLVAPTPAPPSPAPTVVLERTPTWIPRALLRGAVAIGAAPTTAGVLGISAGASRGHFTGLVELRFQIPSGVSVETGRIDVAALSVELLPCFEVGPLRVCALGSAGAFFSWATGLSQARSAVNPLAALGGRVEVTTPLWWRLRLSAYAEVRGSIARSALRVGTAEIWAAPPVSGAVGVAVATQWPVTDSP